ncbi:tannase/feruloyl esterase family alpha/beta hydrolase [Qaidamihabitans albus]|uniref:tannase/feruloyl esterase family alpha/beta hydrolase n=1 Tax=Qaidamihabitans albus TaxID=2795733 RepID=UPI0018F125AA|nr:tannase/feruloyl esterase family alpha/beta hydrolase [Qaidamihabitans albus]
MDLDLPGRTVTGAVLVEATEAVPEYCDVQLKVTDPSSDESFRVGVFLPATTWNGRFLGTGGAGWSAGGPDSPCSWGGGGGYEPCALAAGYATANTDGGVPGNQGEFALDADNNLDLPAINNWGHVAIHQTAVSAKQVITAFYGVGPTYSYFQGGSAGGRQAMMEAQRYPKDYDGIAVFWPALDLARLLPAVLWPHVVMNEEDHLIPQSTFQAVNDRVIDACDGRDGVVDAIVSHWQACDFEARSLVQTGLVTLREARIINKIWAGPRRPDGQFLWHGPLPGTPLFRMAATTTENGTLIPVPREDGLVWVTRWVLQDPDFDWRDITYASFAKIFEKSVKMWDELVGASDADLSAFRAAGGKMVITMGTADTGIPVEGTIAYYDRLTRESGGTNEVRRFARLFLASGGGHDRLILGHPHPGLMPAGYTGAVPSPGSALGALVNWVEHRKAPRQLLGVAQGQGAVPGMTRPLCMYPLVARHLGHRDIADADSFVCSRRYRHR